MGLAVQMCIFHLPDDKETHIHDIHEIQTWWKEIIKKVKDSCNPFPLEITINQIIFIHTHIHASQQFP